MEAAAGAATRLLGKRPAFFIFHFAICILQSSVFHFVSLAQRHLSPPMNESFRQSDLESFLDEALPAEEMSRIEQALRGDAELVRRLAGVHARRDAGVHSLAEVWRRHRLSCPSRRELGGYLLGALPEEAADYIAFHVEAAGCRYCQANFADLEARRAETDRAAQVRRRRYFQSSVGYLRRKA